LSTFQPGEKNKESRGDCSRGTCPH
jgi:hypothetical protein